MEKFEFNDHTYILKENSLKGATIEHNKKRPVEIFKFYGLSRFSIDAFINGYFYASHPIELNDTFDITKFMMYSSAQIDLEFYKHLIQDATTEEEIIKIHKNDNSNPEFFGRWYIENHYDVATNLFGIISMTGRENNILMWPHYTQEMGFQLKFNSEKIEESIASGLTEAEDYLGLFPINYCSKLYPIDISPYNSMFIPVYYVTNIKLETWSYEDEWRFLVGKQNMGVPYSKVGLSDKVDYFVNKENRYVHYDKNLVEEVTVATNFFSGRNFHIIMLDNENYRVTPKNEESNWEFENQVLFLNYVCENLSDRFYHCGRKYEIFDEKMILVRTKERMQIKRDNDGNSYILTRTNDFKTFLD